jgi:hypothetical protein
MLIDSMGSIWTATVNGMRFSFLTRHPSERWGLVGLLPPEMPTFAGVTARA